MSRIAGRNAALYVGIASAGTAEPVAFISQFDFSAQSDRYDVTAFNDGSKVYVAGLPDSSGSFQGFYDNATTQTYQAAVDGIARRWYFYPDRVNSAGTYWLETGFFDFSGSFPVGAAASVTGNFNAATPTLKVG